MEKIDKQAVLSAIESLKETHNLNIDSFEYKILKRTIKELPTLRDNGYTTRNDEVVNLIFDLKHQEITEDQQDILTELLSKVKL